jgi:hypothetical protein
MPSTIKLKHGSGAPSASDIVQGEPALDLTNKRLYSEDGSANVLEIGTNPTELTVDDVAINGKIITMTGSTSDTATITAGTNGTLDIVTTDAAAAAANIQITADGTAELAGTTVTLDSSGGITLDADGGTITFADAGSSLGTITSSGYSGNSASATVATTVTISDNENTNENNAVIFTAGGDVDGGNIGLESDGDLTYNPSTGLLSSTGVTASGTVTFGSLSDGAVTITAFVDEDNMSSNSATLVPTQQSVKAYVDSTGSGTMSSWVLEDGDGTEVTIADAKEVKFVEGGGIDIDWTDTDNGTDADPYDLTFTINAAQTGITSLLATDIKIGEDDETKIDFEDVNTINFYAGNEKQLILTDGALTPGSNAIIDLGTDALEFKDAYFDGTVEADAISIGGTAITSTAAELNILDGVTATTAELNYLDITTLGTSAASKAVTADANGDVIVSQEFRAVSYNETYVAPTSSSNATTIACESGNYFKHTLTENTTFTFSNPPASGTGYSFILHLIQDSSARTVTWPGAVDWAGGSAPTISTGNGDDDFYVFATSDGGTIWYGFTAGQALA